MRTTFGVNSESTYDWQGHEWSVPLNFTISQWVKIGKQPINLQLGYRYYAKVRAAGRIGVCALPSRSCSRNKTDRVLDLKKLRELSCARQFRKRKHP